MTTLAGFDFTKIGGKGDLVFAESGLNFAFGLQSELFSQAWLGDKKAPQSLAQQEDIINAELTKKLFPEIAT